MRQTSDRQLDTRESRSHRKSPSGGRHQKHHHHSRHPRSQSPQRDDDHRKRHRSRSPPPRPLTLPYHAQELSKRNLEEYKPLFQSYLDIQKQINLDDLDEREARGRWKSFVGRWNRGELSRSWYDPSMLKSAQETAHTLQSTGGKRRASPEYSSRAPQAHSDDDDDDFGPAPPPGGRSRHTGHGPTVPGFDDLGLRNELRDEDRVRDQANYVDDIRYERKLDRKTQKERLDELVPRADPGSRERQLEKKRETTSTLTEFRDAKESGDVEVRDADLMGDDGVDVYKKQKKEVERQKNEREIRKEEIMRARAAEREERLADRRAKEAQTMDFLKQIAKERFG
ncbi:uncharacterized protein N0V89_008556 [Didymosphaeria variabile]|uniref:Uncharacterized protein n=1 Tax=Didymosphaeria variabile TaxID=1932322 RepID=A0A9W8XIC8_9PLEO|nr:uncharacterized protein N0V89_008556 [Didymosphaeria variabile]KAJ4349936.1 hypothetical protein N0V89_008556 [Didymosphaeria variabile]